MKIHMKKLIKLRHDIKVLKGYEEAFGGGQAINKYHNTFIAGSDLKKDGLALSY